MINEFHLNKIFFNISDGTNKASSELNSPSGSRQEIIVLQTHGYFFLRNLHYNFTFL